MSNLAPQRRGFLAGGNFIVDSVKIIDAWPEQDTLSHILEIRRCNGGGPYNFLKNLARLDSSMPREACGLIGADVDADWLIEDCRLAEIDIVQLRVREGEATSVTDAMTVASTGRRTFFHAVGANALLGAADFDFSQTQARVFLLGYLMLLDTMDRLAADGSTEAAQVLRRAREAGLIAAVDCVSTPNPRFREISLAALAEADVFFANEIEAGWILGRKVDLASARIAVSELANLGRADAVLHFPEGAFACRSGSTEAFAQGSVRLPSAEIIGATGAGDAFATGYLYGVHEGWSVSQALLCGVCVAAQSLTDATPSGGVASLADCMKLGEIHGYRTLD